MHPESLRPKTAETLALLAKEPWLRDFYLAGGTALALHLGHRISEDLDFFSKTTVDPKNLRSCLSVVSPILVELERTGTLWVTQNETKVSFIEYPYDLLEPKEDFQGVRIASVKDIASMKLDAISSRGSRKDFVDLYFVMKQGTGLAEILLWFERKFQGIGYNKAHLLKSLVYFDDAEKEPELRMLKSCDWKDVRLLFEREATKIVM